MDKIEKLFHAFSTLLKSLALELEIGVGPSVPDTACLFKFLRTLCPRSGCPSDSVTGKRRAKQNSQEKTLENN